MSSHVSRYRAVVRLRPEHAAAYLALHANPWPEVTTALAEAGVRNYSIYERDGLLMSYLEYVGDDLEEDMAKMAADPVTQEWWKICMPMQRQLETAGESEWWASMEEVFHQP